LRQLWPVLSAVLSPLSFMACMRDHERRFQRQSADQVLFARARTAAVRNHFDVARMTLQTLVNTYPDSEYAAKAHGILDDPRIKACGGSENMQFIGGGFSSREAHREEQVLFPELEAEQQ